VIGSTGLISANGEDGGETFGSEGTGGGAGGFVLLASSGSINFSSNGEVQAFGGNGGDPGSTSPAAAGGGGGAGGLIYLIAPSIDRSAGLTQVFGGLGGASLPAGSITSAPYAGGGGGGALVSAGGRGGAVQANGSSSAGQAGQIGGVIQLNEDPTALLLQ